MIIRFAQEEDLPFIYKIALQSFSTPWSLESFKEELANPSSKIKVAEIDGEVVSYIIYRKILDEAEILSLAVKPEFRRKCIAQALVREALEDMKNTVKSCFLEVRVSNLKAINLYEKLGFKKYSIRKKYYLMPDEDAIIMKFEFD